MIIRQATEEDVGEVRSVFNSLNFTRKDENWENRTCGFFECPEFSEKDFLESLNPYFMLAETNEGVRGFSLGYDDKLFEKVFKRSYWKGFEYILDNVRGSYLYINLLGVLNPNSGFWKDF